VRVAVRDEMAMTLSDAVLRRLDLGTAGPPARADLELVVRVMGALLGWQDGQLRSERAALEAAYPPIESEAAALRATPALT